MAIFVLSRIQEVKQGFIHKGVVKHSAGKFLFLIGQNPWTLVLIIFLQLRHLTFKSAAIQITGLY